MTNNKRPMGKYSLIVITGQSGSGKSTALRALEDKGLFCIDNIPTSVVEALIESHTPNNSKPLALVMDAREPKFDAHLPILLARLNQTQTAVRLVFLESDETQILRRFSETRRRHPVDSGMGLQAAIQHETMLLQPIREMADKVINTTALTPHQLKQLIASDITDSKNNKGLQVTIVSFGFKRNMPAIADMIFDVRFLPNPYFVPELKEQTGLDKKVRDYVLNNETTQSFLTHTTKLMQFLLPHFQAEGKSYLTIAIGCTGGQHRSVAIVQELKKRLATPHQDITIKHRDIPRRNI